MASERPQDSSAWPFAPSQLALFALFAVWLAIVGYGAYNHVMWCDEMRALSLTLQAPNFLAIPATVQGEGHPSLWYLVLGLSYDIFKTNAVLPLSSMTLAIIGVALLLWKGPFPLWWKAVVIFSGLPAYEYSIMARDYALIMPLLFGLTIAITSKRRHYWLIAILIFLNMQVEVYATLLTPFFMLILLRDWGTESRNGRIGICICAISVIVGMAAAVASLYPPKHDLVTSSMSGQLSILKAAQHAILSPGREYFTLLNGHEHLKLNFVLFSSLTFFGSFIYLIVTILLYGSCLALTGDAVLLGSAIMGLWITTGFALIVYPMYYRHAGIWLIFLICLYWIFNSNKNKSASVHAETSSISKLSRGSLVLIFILNLGFGIPYIIGYTRVPSSNSRALAQKITADPSLHNAIIVPEPGDMGESLAYSVSNPIYMVREHKFSKIEDWDRTTIANLNFSQVMAAARLLQKTRKTPVIILLEYPLLPGDHIVCLGFSRSLFSTGADYNNFAATTIPLPLGPASDEAYSAYLLRPELAAASTVDASVPALSASEKADNDKAADAGRRAARLQCGAAFRPDTR